MSRTYLEKSVWLIGLVIALLGCGTSAKLVRESSAPVRPSWTSTPPPDSREYRYFVGIQTGASTLEEGKDSAVKDASSEIAEFLRIRIRSEYKERTTQDNQDIEQKISALSAAVVSGAKIIDVYYEKTTRSDSSIRAERYDVYVLVGYPKGEVSKEIDRQENERRKLAEKSLNWYRKGMGEEREKRFLDARESFQRSIAVIDSMDEGAPLEGDFADTGDLRLAAKRKSDEMLRRSRRIAIRCNVQGGAEASQQFAGGFIGTIGQNRFEIGNEDPFYEILGNVQVTEGGIVMGNQVVYAKGSLEVRKIADGRTLSVIPISAKGFHRKRDIASLNAVKEAGSQAGVAVANVIMSSESVP